MPSFSEVYHSLWKAAVIVLVLCLILSDTEGLSEYKTCCAIQTECEGCTSLYKVNSITYCCPDCHGDVLVTALVCTCTIVISDEHYKPNCTVSNKIIGDYYYGRTSFYAAGNFPAVSAPLLLLALCLVPVIRYWTGH